MKGGQVTDTFALYVYFLANDWYNFASIGVSLKTEYRRLDREKLEAITKLFCGSVCKILDLISG